MLAWRCPFSIFSLLAAIFSVLSLLPSWWSVEFKIKGCSYLWAEGVYTRSARTLSSVNIYSLAWCPKAPLSQWHLTWWLCLHARVLTHTCDPTSKFLSSLSISISGRYQSQAAYSICHTYKLIEWVLWYFVKPNVIVLLAVSAVTL